MEAAHASSLIPTRPSGRQLRSSDCSSIVGLEAENPSSFEKTSIVSEIYLNIFALKGAMISMMFVTDISACWPDEKMKSSGGSE